MKVIAINGSPKKEGNTYHAIKIVADELEKENIDVEIIHIGNQVIRGCMGCNTCMKNRDSKCIFNDDIVNETIQKIKAADGLLLGTPVHYSAIGGTMKSFLDRVFYAGGKETFRHKVGASLVAVRRSGGVPAFNQLNNFINYAEMAMPSSNYWNVIHGAAPGEVLQDEEGVQIMRILGKNMAWLLKVIDNGKATVEAPENEKKAYMNFIRK